MRILVLIVAFLTGAEACAGGALVAVGGGSTLKSIRSRVVELTGLEGGDVDVLVVPFASSAEDAGQGSVEMWLEDGVASCSILEIDDREVALRQIERADVIWMPGGSQNRLLERLQNADLVDAIVARHDDGAVVGGTSAGAAVQSPLMITGRAETESIEAGATQVVDGLGLWPNAIVDQHFHARRRFNRLLSAVLAAPDHLGIGVDEATAAILHDGAIEVVGRSSVMIIDARRATIGSVEHGDPSSAAGVIVHVLTEGMTIEVDPTS